MSLPAQINVSFDFNSGATFGFPFTLNDPKYGVIGTSQFAATEVPNPVIDLTPQVLRITTSRGRNVQQDTYINGTAVVRVVDQDGTWNPQNPASPYYGYLVPLRKLRISATVGTSTHWLFSGYTTEYRYSYPTGQELGYVDIHVSDAFRLFNMAQVTTVADAGAGQDAGTRINKILDQVSWPNNMRDIDTATSLCQADPGNLRTSLNAIKNAEYSDQGAFYIQGDGTARYRNRQDVQSSIAGTPIVFNQTGDIPYSNLVYAYNDQLIINQASMTRIGGTAQIYENAASVARYFPHSISQENLIIDTDANALNIAATVVATRAETTIRIDAMTVDLLDDAVPAETMIGLDYFDVLQISNIQPEGSVINKTLQCQGLAWDITPNTMKVTITTLEPITDGFILNSAERGIIGVSAMTY